MANHFSGSHWSTNMRNTEHDNYKHCEDAAQIAACQGNYLKSEALYLRAAELRLQHRDKYYGGDWDEGHKSRYECIVGAAWIQRQAYEDDKIINNISYDRNAPKPRKTYSVWKKNPLKTKNTFASLMKKHKKITQTRRFNKMTGKMQNFRI